MNREPTFEEDVIGRLARIETLLAAVDGRGSDHETRLRAQEHRQWWLAGAAAVVAAWLARHGIHLPSLP